MSKTYETKFKLPAGRRNKNIDEWLARVYENNKSEIDYKVNGRIGRATSKDWFINTAHEYINEGMDAAEAVNYIKRTELFTDKATRLRRNAWEGLKADKTAYNSFKRAVGITRQDQIDWDALKYVGDGTYQYGNLLIIYNNSPFEISFDYVG